MSQRETYTRADIAAEVAARFKIQKNVADKIVLCALEATRAALEAGLRVELRTFGNFELVGRKALVGRNPLYPEQGTIAIPACTVVKFKPCKAMAENIKGV